MTCSPRPHECSFGVRDRDRVHSPIRYHTQRIGSGCSSLYVNPQYDCRPIVRLDWTEPSILSLHELAGLGESIVMQVLICSSSITDMNEGAVGSMVQLGVTESYKLKRQVVVSASEAAEMILRYVLFISYLFYVTYCLLLVYQCG